MVDQGFAHIFLTAINEGDEVLRARKGVNTIVFSDGSKIKRYKDSEVFVIEDCTWDCNRCETYYRKRGRKPFRFMGMKFRTP
jgi:hypothetical protein